MLKDKAWASLLQLKDRPDVSALTYFWNIAEDVVLESWIRQVKPLGSKRMSLHFDAIRLDRDAAQPDAQAFCESCSDSIFQETGLNVTIRVKEHHTFRALLQKISDMEAVECPLRIGFFVSSRFTQSSNFDCVVDRRPRAHVFLVTAAGENVHAYRPENATPALPSTAAAWSESRPKDFAPLGDANGRPHCVALKILPENQVRVTDMTVSYQFSAEHLLEMILQACDRKYIIFFHLNEKPAKCSSGAEESEYEVLLESLAGADREHDDDDDSFVRVAAMPILEGSKTKTLEDDEGVTRVGEQTSSISL